MLDFTASWGWPQWAMLALLFFGFVITASQHDRPRLQTSGDEKGQPERYNAFISLARFALWIFILTAGGFFQ